MIQKGKQSTRFNPRHCIETAGFSPTHNTDISNPALGVQREATSPPGGHAPISFANRRGVIDRHRVLGMPRFASVLRGPGVCAGRGGHGHSPRGSPAIATPKFCKPQFPCLSGPQGPPGPSLPVPGMSCHVKGSSVPPCPSPRAQPRFLPPRWRCLRPQPGCGVGAGRAGPGAADRPARPAHPLAPPSWPRPSNNLWVRRRKRSGRSRSGSQKGPIGKQEPEAQPFRFIPSGRVSSKSSILGRK